MKSKKGGQGGSEEKRYRGRKRRNNKMKKRVRERISPEVGDRLLIIARDHGKGYSAKSKGVVIDSLMVGDS